MNITETFGGFNAPKNNTQIILMEDNYQSFFQVAFNGVLENRNTKKTKESYNFVTMKGGSVDIKGRKQSELPLLELIAEERSIEFIKLINQMTMDKDDWDIAAEEGNLDQMKVRLESKSVKQHLRIHDTIYIVGSFPGNKSKTFNKNALLVNANVADGGTYTFDEKNYLNLGVAIAGAMQKVLENTSEMPNRVLMSQNLYNKMSAEDQKLPAGKGLFSYLSLMMRTNDFSSFVDTSTLLDTNDGGYVFFMNEDKSNYQLIMGKAPELDDDWEKEGRRYQCDMVSSLGNLLIHVFGSISKIKITGI